MARLKGKINHVGLVTLIENDEIFFMHSTTSKGVITSSMKETYWENEFVKATRVL
ncbi:C40 family peptidase [Tenacibaculum sp. AHE15PA]|nr:C40 family peptidase [Tenacibaculum sp. AHE14PA]QXP77323.1 C40 family peptidase [Tenacibaculum sp. AHE15PA]